MNAIWMNIGEIFAWVARASLYAVAVIAVIVLVQALTRRALAAKWICALWIVLLLRLAVPAWPESGWSPWNLAPRQLVSRIFSGFETPANQDTETAADAVIFAGIAAYEPSTAVSGDFSFRRALQTFIPGIWLAGALSVMLGIVIGNLRLWNTVRRLPFVTDRALLELFGECRQSMRVQAMVGLVVTDRVKSPILFGLIRPRVLLPADLVRELPFERLRYILLHELAHLKRRDILTGWILAFLQSLHWFNPLVWWAFGRMRFDRELACDEQVLSRVPNEERRHYGDVLIGILERYNHIHRLPAIAGILENKRQLRRRLVMIKKFRRPERREVIAFAALLAVLSITFLTEPRSLLSQSNEQSSGVRTVNEVRIVRSADDQTGSAVPVGEFIISAQSGVGTETAGAMITEDGRYKDFIVFFPGQAGTAINEPGARTVNEVRIVRSADDQTGSVVPVGEFIIARDVSGAISRATTMPDGMASRDSRQVALVTNQDSIRVEPVTRLLPKALQNPKPDYTQEARDARIEGTIILLATIRKDGSADDIKVVRGLGYGLDESAVYAVAKDWRFSPATRDGLPIDFEVVIEVQFRLF